MEELIVKLILKSKLLKYSTEFILNAYAENKNVLMGMILFAIQKPLAKLLTKKSAKNDKKVVFT